MAEGKGTNVIDFRKLAGKIYSRRKLFYTKVWPITFILSCVYILSIPRYYASEAKLAPEMGGSMDMGGLGSLATSFGFNLGGVQSSDAIYPALYPDLMEDNGFASSLLNIRVKSADGEIDTDYYTYLKDYQKQPWWGYIKSAITAGIKSLLPEKKPLGPGSGKGGEKSPYWLSEDDNGKLEAVRGNIIFSVNEKTLVISIHTTAQDPLVAKILADSAQTHLQQFITDYRTKKARFDVAHYEQLVADTYKEYEAKCQEYSNFSETNANIVMESYKTRMENLQKEMQLKYTAYTSMTGQLEAAKAKLQERTPAFTQMKGASVPLRPAGPKRMIFVLFMLILVTMVTAAVILRHDLTKIITVNRE